MLPCLLIGFAPLPQSPGAPQGAGAVENAKSRQSRAICPRATTPTAAPIRAGKVATDGVAIPRIKTTYR